MKLLAWLLGAWGAMLILAGCSPTLYVQTAPLANAQPDATGVSRAIEGRR